MKGKIMTMLIAAISFFAPIQFSAICLMTIIFIDTLVKLISLKTIAIETKRPYRDVFKSKLLRRGYIFKAAGYFFLAGPLFPLDYFVLTPFVQGSLNALGYAIQMPTAAIFTNLLLIIFCLIELASINENWFDITGNNMLKSVFTTVKKIRAGVENVSDLYKNIKN